MDQRITDALGRLDAEINAEGEELKNLAQAIRDGSAADMQAVADEIDARVARVQALSGNLSAPEQEPTIPDPVQ
jgi:hypothetical protein